jgi:WD40 repeat protein/serine/threonine protein kinase
MSTVDDGPEKDPAKATTVPIETATDDADAAPVSLRARPESLGGRYVPLKPHARGGLGELFVARDEELGRLVAVKTLQARHADEPRTRARFVREAEITGHLEHPGIVPIYSLGKSPDDRPYYAMQLIHGESLERAIAHFHQAERPGRDPGERALSRLHLLGCFLNICNAVDYAHSRGIVHRDLKPSNIMLGRHGETLVVDWGLAKCLPHSEEEAACDSLDTPTVVSSVTDSDLTLPGSTVGTPAFMSPEQAAGRVAEIGPASDIYNLGATLYCILTGRPPYEKGDPVEICARLQRGDFPRPSAVARQKIPPALEAICLKAMALKPQERYPSAQALGEEIRRWIAHEPVSAYTESLGERLARWSRRHRTWVQAALALLVALLVVLTLATVIVHSAWKQELTERLKEERLATSLELDKGLDFLTDGATARGVLRLAHALEIAPAESDLRRTILANLGAWEKPMSPLREILPHQGLVYTAAPSPDGQTVATGSGVVVSGTLRGEARLWNVATGEPLGPPLRQSAPVRSVAFSPDGSMLLTGSLDATVQLWDPARGAPLGAPLVHPAPIDEVAFTPDGQTLVTAGGRFVRFWDAASRAPLRPLPDQAAPVHALALSADGKRLVTGSDDGTAQVWDVATRQPFGPPLVHQAPIQSAAFSPDGTTVLTGGDAGHVLFWEVTTGLRLMPRLEHQSTVYAIAFSPDGRTVLTGSDDNTARLWDAATGQPVGSPTEHRGSVLTVAFAPDGQWLLTGAGDAKGRVWGLAPRQPEKAIVPHAGRVLAVAFSPDGKLLATGDSTGRVQVWDAATGRPLGKPLEQSGEVLVVAYSPDGKTFLTGHSDGTAQLWDARSLEPRGRPIGPLGAACAVAFSPDGKTLLTGAENARAQFWTVTAGQPAGPALPQATDVSAVAYSPRGDRVLVAAGTFARIWDVAARRPLGEPMAHHGLITSVAFRGDGVLAVSGGEDNTARLWDADTGRPLGEPLDHPATVRAVAFSPDGRTLITGCNDRRVRLWDVVTGKPVGPPLEHRGRVVAVAISPDGRTLLSGSFDQTARLWPTPPLLKDDGQRIALWVETLTGMRLDTSVNPAGTVQLLEDAAWHEERRRLERLGGPPL